MLADIPKSRKLLVMLGVMLALFLAALDQTIVATALPRIVQEFHGLEHLSWVIAAYLLASAVVVPIYGKLHRLRRLAALDRGPRVAPLGADLGRRAIPV